jgi:hypothetical protein
MSRVHYKNEKIRKVMHLLDGLEQSIGWNMRCAYPDTWKGRDNPQKDAMDALRQILTPLPFIRRHLDEVEMEVLNGFADDPWKDEPSKGDSDPYGWVPF